LEETYPAIEQRARQENADIYWDDEVGVAADQQPACGYAPKGEAATMDVPDPHIDANLGGGVGFGSVSEDLLSGGEQVLLPILDENRMHAELRGQFVDGLVAFKGGKCYLSLERCRVLLPLGCHKYLFREPPE
jgi:hypothetical protein